MISVPLKELKENLSELGEKAAKGESIQVTKYNKPYFILNPVQTQGLVIGKNVGKYKIKPVLKKSLGELAQRYLQEDRDSDDRFHTYLR